MDVAFGMESMFVSWHYGLHLLREHLQHLQMQDSLLCHAGVATSDAALKRFAATDTGPEEAPQFRRFSSSMLAPWPST